MKNSYTFYIFFQQGQYKNVKYIVKLNQSATILLDLKKEEDKL